MTTDEAKAIIDKFAAADSSMVAIAAVAKQLIDQVAADAQALGAADQRELEELRAKDEARRAKTNERQHRWRGKSPRNVSVTSTVTSTADAASSRVRSSSSFSLRSNSEEGGGGGCAREGARDTHENKLILKEVDPPADPQEMAAEVEQSVRKYGHRIASRDGWMRSTVVLQLTARLKSAAALGPAVARNVILGAVDLAAKTHPLGGPLNSFMFFNKPGGPIERAITAALKAHAEATAQMALPLPPVLKTVAGGQNGRRNSSPEQRFRSRHETPSADGPGSGGTDLAADLPVDAAEIG